MFEMMDRRYTTNENGPAVENNADNNDTRSTTMKMSQGNTGAIGMPRNRDRCKAMDQPIVIPMTTPMIADANTITNAS
jgi:hypothetical protein